MLVAVACGGGSTNAASEVVVEIDLYSGRENPTWTLTPNAAATLASLVDTLEPQETSEPDFAWLGFRRFVVTGLNDGQHSVTSDAVFVNGTALADPAGQVFALLLAEATTVVPNEAAAVLAAQSRE